jgi:predicted secreted protein
VTVKFAKTIANQHRNRDVEQVLVQGNAIITNITQNATNKDLSTYKVQLQGTGMLSIVE